MHSFTLKHKCRTIFFIFIQLFLPYIYIYSRAIFSSWNKALDSMEWLFHSKSDFFALEWHFRSRDVFSHHIVIFSHESDCFTPYSVTFTLQGDYFISQGDFMTPKSLFRSIGYRWLNDQRVMKIEKKITIPRKIGVTFSLTDLLIVNSFYWRSLKWTGHSMKCNSNDPVRL